METTNTPAAKDQKEFQEKLDVIKADIKAKKEAEAFVPPKDEQKVPDADELKSEEPKPVEEPPSPDRSTPTFGFSDEIQRTILALMLRDEEFFKKYRKWVKPWYFALVVPVPEAALENMQRIFEKAVEFYDIHGHLIPKEALVNEIREYLKTSKDSEEFKKEFFFDFIDKLYALDLTSPLKDYSRDKMIKFIIHQGTKEKLAVFARDKLGGINLIDDSDAFDLSKEIGEISQIGRKDEEKAKGITMSEGLNLKIEEPDWIVKPIIERGDKGYLVATYKVGKTLLFQQFVMCLSKKIDFLGFEIPKPRKVVYLRFELKDPKFWKRYKMMNRWEWHKEYLKDPYFELKRGFNISSKDEKDLQWLFRLIDKQEPEVLLLDPLYKMTDLNLADPKSGIVLRSFEKLQERYPDLTIEIAHHKVKTFKDRESDSWDSSYGIFQLFADMDHEMRLSNVGSEKQFKWDFLTNNEPVDSLVLERDPDTLIYKVVTESRLQKKAHKDEANLEAMRNLLIEHSKEQGFLIKSQFQILVKEVKELNIGWRQFERLLEQGKGKHWNIGDGKPVKISPISGNTAD